jgi:ATP-dependent Clp protease protease subunit
MTIPNKDLNSFIKSNKLILQHKNKINNDIMPYIIEESTDNSSILDVFSRLMKDNIIYLGTVIDENVANVVNAQLLFLESQSDDPIWMYINSPGGDVYSGLAIYDVMNLVKAPIYTVIAGMAASMAFILSTSGAKGHRYALKHSRLLLHQPSGGSVGQATDIAINNKEIQIIKKELYEIVSLNTGQSFNKVKKDGERDYWMKTDDALKYGAIDKILTTRKI